MKDQNRRRKKILVIDDERTIATALALILELEGYESCVAHSGVEGLRQITEQKPDLVITDYLMPGLNGLELIGHIRADADLSDVPIIMFSAAIPRLPADSPGPTAYVSKTGSTDVLLTQVEELLTL